VVEELVLMLGQEVQQQPQEQPTQVVEVVEQVTMVERHLLQEQVVQVLLLYEQTRL